MCWVIPPNSPDTTFALLKTSNTDVLPWSTCPITVTIGGLFFKFSDLDSLIFCIISSAFVSFIGLWPNSLTKYSAVSDARLWLIVTVTPIPSKCLIKLLDCSAILFAKSLTVIDSGIFTSLFTGLKFSWVSSFLRSLFSFCFALLREAKLLDRVSIASLKALETVSFSSLFFGPVFVFRSLDKNSPLTLLVALCSASLRFSKLLVIGAAGLKNPVSLDAVKDFFCGLLLWSVDLLNELLPTNLLVFFSITTVFLLWVLANSIFCIDFLAIPESVNFVFLFAIFHHSIFINFISCWHNQFICFIFW